MFARFSVAATVAVVAALCVSSVEATFSQGGLNYTRDYIIEVGCALSFAEKLKRVAREAPGLVGGEARAAGRRKGTEAVRVLRRSDHDRQSPEKHRY